MCTFELLDVLSVVEVLLLGLALLLFFVRCRMLMATFRGEERLLGVRVHFHTDTRGWFWRVTSADVTCSEEVRFGSRLSARVSAMACIFAYAMIEECSAVTIPSPDARPDLYPPSSTSDRPKPPQGGGG